MNTFKQPAQLQICDWSVPLIKSAKFLIPIAVLMISICVSMAGNLTIPNGDFTQFTKVSDPTITGTWFHDSWMTFGSNTQIKNFGGWNTDDTIVQFTDSSFAGNDLSANPVKTVNVVGWGQNAGPAPANESLGWGVVLRREWNHFNGHPVLSVSVEYQP